MVIVIKLTAQVGSDAQLVKCLPRMQEALGLTWQECVKLVLVILVILVIWVVLVILMVLVIWVVLVILVVLVVLVVVLRAGDRKTRNLRSSSATEHG